MTPRRELTPTQVRKLERLAEAERKAAERAVGARVKLTEAIAAMRVEGASTRAIAKVVDRSHVWVTRL